MMNEALAPLVDISVKIGLLILGAALGASLSAYLSRLRLRRLLRSLLRQVHAAVKVSQGTFSPEEAALCLPQLESAIKLLQDFVAAGVKGADWNNGLECLERARLAANRTASSSVALASGPASLLRGEAESLNAWLKTVA